MLTDELIDEICSLLSTGVSLRTVCTLEHMPEMQTVWRWLREDSNFSERYARAKEESADALAEDIQRLAYDILQGKYDPSAGRVAIDALKWTASKLKPKRYGDKIDLSVTQQTPVLIYKPEQKTSTQEIAQEPDSDTA